MSDIKSCSFCGGHAKLTIGPIRGDTTSEYKIECERCGASVWDYISSYQPDAGEMHQKLVDEWNEGKAWRSGK